MNQRLLTALGRSQRLQIVNALKRSEGMSVKELAAALDMSYMGIKQHCIEMEKTGYLDHWRRPKAGLGRPEMLYRLTRQCEELFPNTHNTLTLEMLDAAKTLFGPQSPEKLLFLVFQNNAQTYRSKIKGGTLEEKAKWLARLRDDQGYMADLQITGGCLTISEAHSPILELARVYPCIARLEEKMFETVLDAPVRREELHKAGLYHCRFTIG